MKVGDRAFYNPSDYDRKRLEKNRHHCYNDEIWFRQINRVGIVTHIDPEDYRKDTRRVTINFTDDNSVSHIKILVVNCKLV